MRSSSTAALVCLLAGVLLAGPAAGVPVVFEARAVLEALGADDLALDGASLVLVASADTDDTPTSVFSGSGSEWGSYSVSIEARVSGRPGGAPDVTLTYDSILRTVNLFTGDAFPDSFTLGGSELVLFEGVLVSLPAFSADFLDQSFFPGTGVAALPLFAASDVRSLVSRSMTDEDRVPTYGAITPSFTAVPEPATGVLVAVGLVLLGRAQVVRPACTRRIRNGRPIATHAISETPAMAKAAR